MLDNLYYLIYVNGRLVYKVHTTKDCIDKTCMLKRNGYKDNEIKVETIIGSIKFNK